VLKALVPLINAGLPVKVASPPEGKDPDDLIRELGAKAVAELLKQARSGDDFFHNYLTELYDHESTSDRHRLLIKLVDILASIKERTITDKLIARISGWMRVSSDTLRHDLRQLYSGVQPSETVAPPVFHRPSRLNRDWGLLIWLLFNDRKSGFEIVDALETERFPPELAPVVEYAYDELLEGRLPEVAPLLAQLEPKVRELLLKPINIEELTEEHRKMAVQDCLARVAEKERKAEVARLRAELRATPNDDERHRELLRQIIELRQQRK
jgi:DNA primase